MKFLIFNLTVAAALFYLISADRAEFQVAAGRVHDAAGEIKSMAERAVDKGRKMLDRPPQPSPAAAPRAAVETPVVEIPVVEIPVVEDAVVAPAFTPTPAVAQRRDEILNGVGTGRQRLSLKDGTRMMTPQQRRRELFSLAEEMELLYARTVSR